jgi:LysM repeat protein
MSKKCTNGFSKIGFTVAAVAATALLTGAKGSASASETQSQSAVQEMAWVAPVTTARVISPGGEYTVRAGDTLAKIAGREYGNSYCWTGIYEANRGEIRNPDMIYTGQRLEIPGGCSEHGPVQTDAAVSRAQPQPRRESGGGYSVNSSFQACVIRTESGGNPDIWNASAHWGLYQFSEQTWIGYGGAASLFGSASAAYQTQIFDNAMATPGGADNWAPYDGC